MTLATVTRPYTGTGATMQRIDRALGLLAEVPAALLVVAEIVLLSAGVVSRYVFQSPLTWSDELASALFLWLAMLGAVVALRRGEHMRLTVFVNRAHPAARAWLEAIGAAVTAACLLGLMIPAAQYMTDQWDGDHARARR